MKAPKALLMGSYTKHSANEFLGFVKDINPHTSANVVDYGEVGIGEADSSLGKIRGDVTKLPVKDDSIDIMFTNRLLPFLTRGERGAPAEARYIISMLEESHRALSPSGVLLMTEGDASGGTDSSSTAVSLFLTLVSLRRAGFEDVSFSYGKRYKDHEEKLKGQPGKGTKGRIGGVEEAKIVHDHDDSVVLVFEYTIKAHKSKPE